MTRFTSKYIASEQWARTVCCVLALWSITLVTAPPSLSASHRLNAREITDAHGEHGTKAIPYRDLQREAKNEHSKQERTCKNYAWKNGDSAGEISAKLIVAADCRELRVSIRDLFKQAEGRLKRYRKEMLEHDDLISAVEDIMDVLEDSASNHNTEIGKIDKAVDKLERQLKKLD